MKEAFEMEEGMQVPTGTADEVSDTQGTEENKRRSICSHLDVRLPRIARR